MIALATPVLLPQGSLLKSFRWLIRGDGLHAASVAPLGRPIMPSITETAQLFFAACEAGKGWEVCSAYCSPDATFSAQAEPLLEVRTLRQYTDWMKGLMTVLTDGSYEVRSFATDAERQNVCAYGVFTGTH
jgi:hypothetical protein